MRWEDGFKCRSKSSRNVLLVDDEEDMGWIMKEVFRGAGHSLIFASTAREGMRKFKRSRNLDIAIIDLRLNNESGLKFVKKAKEINKKVKFVMASAFGPADIKTKARRLGVRHFLEKPIRTGRLLEIVDEAGRGSQNKGRLRVSLRNRDD